MGWSHITLNITNGGVDHHSETNGFLNRQKMSLNSYASAAGLWRTLFHSVSYYIYTNVITSLFYWGRCMGLRRRKKQEMEQMRKDSQELYSSTNFVRESKSRRKRWVENVHIWGRIDRHKGFLVGKAEGKKHSEMRGGGTSIIQGYS